MKSSKTICQALTLTPVVSLIPYSNLHYDTQTRVVRLNRDNGLDVGSSFQIHFSRGAGEAEQGRAGMSGI